MADGFFYVAIPADEAMRQVYFPSQVTELNDLSFIRALRAELGKEALATDGLRQKLLEELVDSSRVGPNQRATANTLQKDMLQEEDRLRDALQKVDNDQLELLASMRTFKVIALRNPTQDSAKKGVFLYHEDTQEGPVNQQATNLCLAAGFPPQDIRGTCFLSQTEDFFERDCLKPIWRRCDFTLQDCNENAQWFKDARRARDESGLKQKEDAEWFSGLKDGGAPMAEGDSDLYAWKQTSDEVEVVFHPGPFTGIRATKKDIVVKFSRRSLFVRLRGRVLCQDVVLAGEVDPENSFWTFDRSSMELQVTLSKAEAVEWKSLLKETAQVSDATSLKAEPVPNAGDHEDLVPNAATGDIEAGAAGATRGEGVEVHVIPQAAPRRRRWRSLRVFPVLLLYYVLVWLAWNFSKKRGPILTQDFEGKSKTWR